MAWSYSNYVTMDHPQRRLAQLRLHYQEVVDAISARIQADGTSVDPTTVQQYLQNTVAPELRRSEAAAGTGRGGVRVHRGRLWGAS